MIGEYQQKASEKNALFNFIRKKQLQKIKKMTNQVYKENKVNENYLKTQKESIDNSIKQITSAYEEAKKSYLLLPKSCHVFLVDLNREYETSIDTLKSYQSYLDVVFKK